MKRKLEFKDGIIPGDLMRDIVYIFPQTESAFRQRKSFDEYYWDRELLLVDISVEKIQALNEMFYELRIGISEIMIN